MIRCRVRDPDAERCDGEPSETQTHTRTGLWMCESIYYSSHDSMTDRPATQRHHDVGKLFGVAACAASAMSNQSQPYRSARGECRVVFAPFRATIRPEISVRTFKASAIQRTDENRRQKICEKSVPKLRRCEITFISIFLRHFKLRGAKMLCLSFAPHQTAFVSLMDRNVFHSFGPKNDFHTFAEVRFVLPTIYE